jgi:hypothetical protein
MTLDYHLFLGFPITEIYRKQLNDVSQEVRSVFIRDHADYLQYIEQVGQAYLGKRLNVPVDVSSLELMHDHIYSLLKCLIPAYSYEDSSLMILTIPS